MATSIPDTLDSSATDDHIVCFGTAYAADPDTGGILMPLGGRSFPGLFAIVDRQDVLKVGLRGWSAFQPNTRGDRVTLYAKARISYQYVYLHRYVLGLTDSSIKVDHINHNGLDNRRENLRLVTHQQNIFNRLPNLIASSPYKGVRWSKQHGKWIVYIKVNGKSKYLGVFTDETDAARAYDAAAAKHFGEHAWLNFPEEWGRDARSP